MTSEKWNSVHASYVDELLPGISKKTKDVNELALREVVEGVALTTMTNLFLIG